MAWLVWPCLCGLSLLSHNLATSSCESHDTQPNHTRHSRITRHTAESHNTQPNDVHLFAETMTGSLGLGAVDIDMIDVLAIVVFVVRSGSLRIIIIVRTFVYVCTLSCISMCVCVCVCCLFVAQAS